MGSKHFGLGCFDVCLLNDENFKAGLGKEQSSTLTSRNGLLILTSWNGSSTSPSGEGKLLLALLLRRTKRGSLEKQIEIFMRAAASPTPLQELWAVLGGRRQSVSERVCHRGRGSCLCQALIKSMVGGRAGNLSRSLKAAKTSELHFSGDRGRKPKRTRTHFILS